MQFSERWLRTLADPPLDTAALCDKLTMGGFEVEEARSVARPSPASSSRVSTRWRRTRTPIGCASARSTRERDRHSQLSAVRRTPPSE
jgi:hypothetical protein